MKKLFVSAVFCILMFFTEKINAMESDYAYDSGFSQESCFEEELSAYDFTEIDEALDDSNFSFSECLKKIISGNANEGFSDILQILSSTLISELKSEKKIIIKIIIIGLIAALFSNVTGGILSGKISETGFYITYMVLIVCVLTGYTVAAELVKNTMQRLSNLMEAITPVYILSIGFSTGESSASAFYQVVVIVITLIEKILLNFIVPMIYVYMIINVINNLLDGKMFTKAQELFKIIIEWTLKTTLTFVIGINIIRSLINPILDSIKTGTVWKVIQSIPGVGGTLNSVSSLILASGTIIKNGIGVTAMIAVLVVCFVPVAKSAIISICYKAVSAVLEPVSDKRVVNCINGIHESLGLLLKTLLYATIFFILTIAVICASTNYHVT